MPQQTSREGNRISLLLLTRLGGLFGIHCRRTFDGMLVSVAEVARAGYDWQKEVAIKVAIKMHFDGKTG